MPYLILSVFALAPAYVLRFSLGPLPANLPMVWVFFVWLAFACWLWQKQLWPEFVSFIKNSEKKLLVLVALFSASGIIALFIHGFSRAKLGQFTVLFLQPISVFFISRYLIAKFPKTRRLLLVTCYSLLAAAGLYAAIQYFSLFGLPVQYWGNSVEPKRAVSFFTHPNFYALWSAPLLAFLIPDLRLKIEDVRKNWHFILGWVIGSLGLLLSFSRAGWLSLFAAAAVYLIVAADNKVRKIFFAAAAAAILVAVATPNLRYRLLLPFYGEKSAVSRLSLWETGWKGTKESPIFGLGLTGFAQNWQRLNTDPGLAADSHNFPHNIFLNFWTETGILGLLSFMGLVGLYIFRGLRRGVIPSLAEGSLNSPIADKEFLTSDVFARNGIFKLSIALFLVALLTQGLIDNPYFKNDLAMVFWIILSLI